ncbi:cytochrome P450 [Phascolomyces articulosus]|uniref:Cytochrome P450 n=1 Tax=Phascolomyces articulosus TaxID=60185 RepID=A0AAD5KB30_9FUNG|nr:cytochrome P450 [Phascolomyces articulosus]
MRHSYYSPTATTDPFSSLWHHGGNVLTTASSNTFQKLKEVFLVWNHSRHQKHWITTTTLTIIVAYGSYTFYKTILRRKQRQQKDASEVKLVSGALPWMGHLLDLHRDPDALIHRGKTQVGPLFRIQLANNTNVYVLTGPWIDEMLHSPRRFNGYAGFQIVMPIERSIQISYGHKFKPAPSNPRDKDPVGYTVRENFKPNNLGIFSARIQQGFNKALNDIPQLQMGPGEMRIIQMEDTMAWMVSQISCLCLTGTEIGYNKDLVHTMRCLAPKIAKTALVLSFFPNWISEYIVQKYLSLEKDLDTIMEIVVPELERIQNKDKRFLDGGDEEDESSFISMALNIPPKSNGTSRTPKEITIAFTKVALGSIDTTRDIVIFILYELAYNPTLVQELRVEIEKLDKRTPDTIQNIRLLDSILREVLRCKAISLTLLHKTSQDVRLSDKVIPHDSLVIGAINDAHMDPTVMKETTTMNESSIHPSSSPLTQFDPYRYMNITNNGEDDEKWKSTSIGPEFLTFGLSAHACPGRFFAAYQVKYIVAELVMRYNIIPTIPSHERPKDHQFLGLTRTPPNIPLIFEGRSQEIM